MVSAGCSEPSRTAGVELPHRFGASMNSAGTGDVLAM
jgi:hypothetical protein